MDDPSSGAPPDPERPAEGRLDSWKEIAAYLKRDVTTVQRWEKREGMPVQRHLHDRLGTVYAFRSELDAWARGRNPQSPADTVETAARAAEPTLPGPPGAPTRPARRNLMAVVAALVAAVVVAALALWVRHRPDFRDPLADARFEYLTDFDGIEQAAAVSRDGRFVAFLSDRDGQPDVWITQIGTGQFHNLTRGAFRELVNPSVRTIGFSPDGALVTFWVRRPQAAGADISVWAVPTLGGEARPYLAGAAEVDWSGDGARLVYHTPGAGDPTFVKDSARDTTTPIHNATPGLHAHFPLWSRDQAFIYFVEGAVPNAMDIWRVRAGGGDPERITHHASRVSYPVMVDDRTLLYLATDADGSGPWLYTVDTEDRTPRRATSGIDRYTSLAASADGHRLVLTIANPKGTLWRMGVGGAPADVPPLPITLTTGSGFAPRMGAGYLLYVSSKGKSDSIWRLADGGTTELWTADNARIIGSPAIGAGGRIAFSAAVHGRTNLYVMNADGTDARVVTAALDLRGAPSWAPGGSSITSAVGVNGTPRLFAIALDGSATPLVRESSSDPVWSPDGAFMVYSGPETGTTFPLRAATATGEAHALPSLTLTRGARSARFLGESRALVFMRGDIQHKDLWRVDLESGEERQLTRLPRDFDVRDFDVSPDGREAVLERLQEHSDVVLLDRAVR